MDNWSAYETLPDGRERVLTTGLTTQQMLAYVPPPGSWAVHFALDT